MLRKILQLLFSVFGGALGYILVELGIYVKLVKTQNTLFLVLIYLIFVAIGFILFYLISPKLNNLLQKALEKTETSLQTVPPIDVAFGAVGLLFGLILSFFITKPFSLINMPVIGNFIEVVLTIVVYFIVGTFFMRLAVKSKDEILSFFSRERVMEKEKEKKISKKNKTNLKELKDQNPKILDTSVIIDGRILPIVETGFVEGPLVISEFVLEELQFIADSSDDLKRERGRRGLDIVKKLQEVDNIKVIITDKDYDNIKEVDTKLLRLTKDLNGKIVTNDYNLNKVALVQALEVLNVNDLANSVKTIVIPGEQMMVNIIKEGKEKDQGLAYLEDGTMIVIEAGKALIGQEVHVMVTTVLQTAAGKMIFAKPMN